MKKLFQLSIVLFLVAPALYGQQSETFVLDSVISVINKSIDATILDSDKIDITDAKISLKVDQSGSSGAGFRIIFKAKAKYGWENASEVTYSYSNPKIKALAQNEGLKSNNKELESYKKLYEKMEKSLVKILKSSVAATKASTANIGNLTDKTFEVTVSFTVTKSGETGFEFNLFDAIEADISAEIERTAVHSITLSFKVS